MHVTIILSHYNRRANMQASNFKKNTQSPLIYTQPSV